MADTIGTTQDVIMEGPTPPESYQAYSKLNIIKNQNETMPQLMLAQTTQVEGSTEPTWNGNNVSFNYVQTDNNQHSFEIKATDEKINFEFLGDNNFNFNKTNDNLLLLSFRNKFDDNSNSNVYMHAAYNRIYNYNEDKTNSVLSSTFIGCKGNDITLTDDTTYKNNSLYNSNNNTFEINKNDQYHTDKSLQNNTFINCNNNFIEHGNYEYSISTYINSFNCYYDNWSLTGNNTCIGNTLSFIKDNYSDIIGIGQGLVAYNQHKKRIILGYYNSNTMDDDDILVVGDGAITNETELNTYKTNDWYRNKDTVTALFNAISGDKNQSDGSFYYRHNIFTVNKKGYIKLSDYTNTSNYVYYGYDGISAHINDNVYNMKYSDIFKYIVSDNVNRIVNKDLEDSLIQSIEDKLYYEPTYRVYQISTSITANSYVDSITDNTIVTFSNTGINSVRIDWLVKVNGTMMEGTNITISPSKSVQLLYRDYTKDTNWNISGYSLVE